MRLELTKDFGNFKKSRAKSNEFQKTIIMQIQLADTELDFMESTYSLFPLWH